MSTPFSEELLSAYLDGELPASEREEVERRLEASPQLREQLDDLAEVGRRVRSLPRPAPPDDFQQAVLLRVREISAARPAAAAMAPRRRRAVWISTATAAGLLLTVLILRNGPDGFDTIPVEYDIQHAAATRHLDAEAAPMHVADAFGRPMLGVVRETPPVRVVSLSKAQLQQKLGELGRPPIVGNTLSYLRQAEGVPLLVEFTVVDVMESMDQMQVLLRQQAVHASSGEQIVTTLDGTPGDQLTAVYLELNESQMASLLQEVPALNAVAYVDAEAIQDELPRSVHDDILPFPPSGSHLRDGAFEGLTAASPAGASGASEPEALNRFGLPSRNESKRHEGVSPADAEKSGLQKNFNFNPLLRGVDGMQRRSAVGRGLAETGTDLAAQSERPPTVPLPEPTTQAKSESAQAPAASPVVPESLRTMQQVSDPDDLRPGSAGRDREPQPRNDTAPAEQRVRAVLFFRQQPEGESSTIPQN